MDGYGAMLAFEHPDADEVCRRVRVITHAKSLGGVESLIERRAPGLLRLSVGCEHVEDLWDRPGAGAVRAGVDIGGTFTDLCIAGPDGIVAIGKALGTPAAPAESVETVLRDALERAQRACATAASSRRSCTRRRSSPTR